MCARGARVGSLGLCARHLLSGQGRTSCPALVWLPGHSQHLGGVATAEQAWERLLILEYNRPSELGGRERVHAGCAGEPRVSRGLRGHVCGPCSAFGERLARGHGNLTWVSATLEVVQFLGPGVGSCCRDRTCWGCRGWDSRKPAKACSVRGSPGRGLWAASLCDA